MTTPAANTNTSQVVTSNYRSRGNWYPPGYWSQGSFTTSTNIAVFIRPQSVTNKIRPDGTRPPSAFSIQWCQASVPFGRWTVRQDVGGGNWLNIESVGSSAMIGSSFSRSTIVSAADARWIVTGTPTDFPATVENLARTNFLNKVASSKASLGSALTEFKGTVETVAHAAESIAHIVNGIAKRVRVTPTDVGSFLTGGAGAFKPSAQLGNDITSLWLAKQYGVEPLLQDIDGAAQVLNDALFERYQAFLLLVRSGAKIVVERPITIPADAGETWWNLEFPCRISTACHYTGIYEIPRTSDRQYQQSGLGNAPAAFWEAVRWSFAVDHVLNSGKWLNSLMAIDGLHWREGSRSRIQRVESLNALGAYRPSGTQMKLVSGFDPPHVEAKMGRFDRSVLANGVFPAFMPSVKARLGLDFMSNMLSILANMAYARSGPRLY